MTFDLGDYQDVKARHADFKAKHPGGCLRPANLEQPYRVETIAEHTFIVYVAAAYRTPDDPTPGIGTAWEPFPGRTSYTRDSELQNAETSAWGRAIAASLAVDLQGGVASRDEVRNRQRDQDTAPPAPVLPPEDDTPEPSPAVAVPPDVDLDAIEEVKATYQALDDDQQTRFMEWRAAQGFQWPWTAGDCGRMAAELARIIASDAVDLAAAPCYLCGSKRARRVLDAQGRPRCANGNDCKKRVAALEAPFVEADDSALVPASTAGESVGSSPDSPAASTGGGPITGLPADDGDDQTLGLLPSLEPQVSVAAPPPVVSEVPV